MARTVRPLLWLLLSAALAACDPGGLTIYSPDDPNRQPPPSSPKGASSVTAYGHGALAPIQVDGGGGG